ncbi:MAG: SAM-dependent methyltransferase [Solirubrobacteraceae bacterium]
MTSMSTADFEARYRADSDPWGYRSSEYERGKYEATLAACGPGPFDSALELGGSIGVFSAMLAPRCRSLVTVDAAPTAVREARARLRDEAAVEVVLGELPAAIPVRAYTLVVASEILYYLPAEVLEATFTSLTMRMAPGARMVAVHWRPGGPERPFTAAEVHDRLRSRPWLTLLTSSPTEDYLLDVLERT